MTLARWNQLPGKMMENLLEFQTEMEQIIRDLNLYHLIRNLSSKKHEIQAKSNDFLIHFYKSVLKLSKNLYFRLKIGNYAYCFL